MLELNQIALKIVSNGKGILAADESTGSMTKRLDSVNVISNPDNRLNFRETFFGLPLGLVPQHFLIIQWNHLHLQVRDCAHL